MELSNEELEYYARQICLPEFSIQAQTRLKQSSVLVIGAGGLGVPVLQYLTAAGVGKIGILDADIISVSNLHRQVLFAKEDVGKPKVEIAKEKLQRQNPYIQIEIFQENINVENAISFVSKFDVICDCTDNFATRYLINDACVLAQKPLVNASILRFQGQLSVFNYKTKINYRDVFPEPPEHTLNCAEAGVIGALCGIMGSMQANEVIKIITQIGETLEGKLWCFDVLKNEVQTFNITSSEIPIVALQNSYTTISCSASTEIKRKISPQELHQMLIEKREFQLIDVREKWEFDIAHLSETLIPLATLPGNINQVSKENPVIIYCKGGTRSDKAVELLLAKGFTNVSSLQGGIIAYAKEIDARLPIY